MNPNPKTANERIWQDPVQSDAVLLQIALTKTSQLPTTFSPELLGSLRDEDFMRIATLLAEKSYTEHGCPIGAVIIDKDRHIIGKGHNTRGQENSSIMHGETAAIRDAEETAMERGQGPVNFADATLFTTLTPCRVCCVQLNTRTCPNKVIIGDITNAPSSAAKLLAGGIEVDILQDSKTIALYKEYADQFPEKHYGDWLGERWWQEHKHLSADERLAAAVSRTHALDAADAAVYQASQSGRVFADIGKRSTALSAVIP